MKVNIRTIYKNFETICVQRFIKKVQKECIELNFFKDDYKGNIDIDLIFVNNGLELEKIVKKYKSKNVVVVTECVNPEIIIDFLKYTSCICYINASAKLIVRKIKFYVLSR